ncbi:MAG: hypothetical protein KDC98_01035 [Planctomycetes bacterium]|nr:hypothetical protein [Planctomycetota bacterium]
MRRPSISIFTLTFSLAFGATAITLPGQCTPQWRTGADVAGVVGAVHASLEWDPDGAGPATPVLIVGGAITAAGNQPAAGIAQWDPTTGIWSPLGAGVTGEVFAMATLANGDLVVAGSLTAAGGVAVASVARWNGGTWSPFGSGLDGDVRALCVLPTGELVIGGAFTAANAVALGHVALWNGSAWTPIGAGVPAVVTAFAVMANGELVAGWGPEPAFGRSYVSRWDGSNWIWMGTASGSGLTSIRGLEVLPNGDLIVGGRFDGFGPSYGPMTNISRLSGTTWLPFGNGLTGPVYDLQQLPGGRLIAATEFNYTSSRPDGVVEWNGSTWTRFSGGQELASRTGRISTLTSMANGNLFAGGDFDERSTAQWNGTTWEALGDGIDRPITAMTMLQNGDAVCLTRPATSLLRWDGAHWSSMAPPTDGPIRAVAELPGGDLVAAGDFTTAGGVAANRIARWDGNAWHPLGGGLDDEVLALAVLPGGDLIAAGRFLHAGGVAVTRMARWNGTAWSTMGNPSYYYIDPFTHLLVDANGGLYAACGSILYWDGSSWRDTGAPVPGDAVTCMTLVLGSYVAVARGGRVEVYDHTQWDGLVSANGPIHTVLSLPDSSIVVGGDFTTLGNIPVNHLGRTGPGVWHPLGNGVGGAVRTLAWDPRGELLVGGDFEHVGGAVLSPHFGSLASTCLADTTSIATACTGTLGPVTLSALGRPWIGSTFRSRATGFAPGSLGIALVGLTSPNQPLSLIWPNTAPGCDLLSSNEAILATWPQNGATSYAFRIPNAVAFAGMPLYHQYLQFEILPGNQLGALSGSNALRLVIGAF